MFATTPNHDQKIADHDVIVPINKLIISINVAADTKVISSITLISLKCSTLGQPLIPIIAMNHKIILLCNR